MIVGSNREVAGDRKHHGLAEASAIAKLRKLPQCSICGESFEADPETRTRFCQQHRALDEMMARPVEAPHKGFISWAKRILAGF